MPGVGPTRVFVDANVLYSRTLRDWLALLAVESPTPPYRVFWSEDVMAETIHHLRQRHPEWEGRKVAIVREHIAGCFEDGRVDDFVVDGSYPGRDQGDAHVHAAATQCAASYLLTCNVTDFPTDDTTCYDVVSPDDFFVLVDNVAPAIVRAVTDKQSRYWSVHRPEALLAQHLEAASCPEFAERVRRHQAAIGGIPYLSSRKGRE